MKQLLSNYGNLVSFRLAVRRDSTSKGFGFCVYEDAATAVRCVMHVFCLNVTGLNNGFTLASRILALLDILPFVNHHFPAMNSVSFYQYGCAP